MLFVGRILSLFLSVFIPIIMLGSQASSAPYHAAASFEPAVPLLNDLTSTAFTFSVHNTGTSVSIGAVAIEPPSSIWTILGCSQGPAGWTAELSGGKCLYRSEDAPSDDIGPGLRTGGFRLAATARADANYSGAWKVTVSKANHFDDDSTTRVCC
jgi:hypothetical protein